MKKCIVLSVVSTENSKTLKMSYIFNNNLVLSITCGKCSNNDDKIFKQEESIEILRILGLINNK